MYCVRCKSKFQPHGGSKEMARNGAMMMKCSCPRCGGRCSQFIGRGQKGKGLFKVLKKIIPVQKIADKVMAPIVDNTIGRIPVVGDIAGSITKELVPIGIGYATGGPAGALAATAGSGVGKRRRPRKRVDGGFLGSLFF